MLPPRDDDVLVQKGPQQSSSAGGGRIVCWADARRTLLSSVPSDDCLSSRDGSRITMGSIRRSLPPPFSMRLVNADAASSPSFSSPEHFQAENFSLRRSCRDNDKCHRIPCHEDHRSLSSLLLSSSSSSPSSRTSSSSKTSLSSRTSRRDRDREEPVVVVVVNNDSETIVDPRGIPPQSVAGPPWRVQLSSSSLYSPRSSSWHCCCCCHRNTPCPPPPPLWRHQRPSIPPSLCALMTVVHHHDRRCRRCIPISPNVLIIIDSFRLRILPCRAHSLSASASSVQSDLQPSIRRD
jgi:hypothetical protein